MVRNAIQKERAKDKRLQREYGINLAEFERRRTEQNNQCKICHVIFDDVNLPCVDHFHYKVQVQRSRNGPYKWEAQGFAERGPVSIECAQASTKSAAIAAVRARMQAWSVRGLLCRKCNRGLGYIERFFDAARHPNRLLPVLEYFRARLK
jgi:hypothetical protein